MTYDVGDMYCILGLGNPEDKYVNTRHNIGRDFLYDFHKGDWQLDKQAQALRAKSTLGGVPVEWLLPETFMNKSGDTVWFLNQKLQVSPAEIIVVYDDIDLPLGELKVSVGRGDGGHNGIKSIIKALGSKDFIRLRVGIAPRSFWTGKTVRPTGQKMSRHVLSKFTKGERNQLATVAEKLNQALSLIVTEGVEKAMNKVN